LVGLESEHDGIDQNDADYEGNDARGFDPAGEPDAPWGRALRGEAVDELLFQIHRRFLATDERRLKKMVSSRVIA
jgi:hypothetical protein